MAEIDDDSLSQLRRAYDLLQKMNGDPSSRSHLERAVKVHHPEVTTEEEQAARLAEPHVKPLQDKITELQTFIQSRFDAEDAAKKAAEDAAADGNLRNALTDIKKSRGFTDEGISKVVQMMMDNGIADPYAAAARYSELNPKPAETVSAWEPSHWKVADDDAGGPTTKDWFTDPERTSDIEIGRTLKELRSVN